jgi:hypothetical protein
MIMALDYSHRLSRNLLALKAQRVGKHELVPKEWLARDSKLALLGGGSLNQHNV